VPDGAGALTIGEVDFQTGWEAVAPLLPAHYEEIALFRDVYSLSPDYERYRQMADEGRLLVLIARDGKRCVGYCVTIAAKALHDTHLQVYQNDVIYIDPAYRGGRLFLGFRRTTRRLARQKWGAGLLTWHAKAGSALDKILEKLDCPILDIVRAERV
jgi:hypothetical protein